jgi:hypothetical protein
MARLPHNNALASRQAAAEGQRLRARGEPAEHQFDVPGFQLRAPV